MYDSLAYIWFLDNRRKKSLIHKLWLDLAYWETLFGIALWAIVSTGGIVHNWFEPYGYLTAGLTNHIAFLVFETIHRVPVN